MLRYRSLSMEVLRENRSYMTVKALSQLVHMKERRLEYLMAQYVEHNGAFKQSQTEKKLLRTPAELIDHALEQETL